jgi:hypothetical protein
MTEAALTIRQEIQPIAAAETSAIVSMIERAASDQRVDVDKLERLMAMRERMEAKQAETAFNIAMKDAQSEMRPVAANALNPQTKSKYATYAKLDSELRPLYTKHGFSLSFDEDDSPKPDHIRVVCYVAHEGGHTRTYRKDMPADGKGAKGGDVMTKTHATGAAASYGARYLLKGIFNIAVGEEDKDGNAPRDEPQFLTEDQVMELRDLILSVDGEESFFKKAMQVEHLKDIYADKFEAAKSLIKQKARR